MKTTLAVLIALSSVSAFANVQSIFNLEKKKSVVDLARNSRLQVWEKYTYVSELCFKGDVKAAYSGIIALKDMGIILSDSETDEFRDAKILGSAIKIKTYSSKVEDEGENPISTTTVKKCTF